MEADAYSLAGETENDHWWYRGRRAVLKSVLDRYVPTSCRPLNVLEIGCGNGGNLPLLSTYGKVFAVETDDRARARASQRRIAKVEVGWLPDKMPFDNKRFDLITALDVIEHIEDDGKTILALRQLLTPNGLLVMTAPAYMWLWSQHDQFSHHKRRYTRSQLVALMTRVDLNVHYSTYFNTLLFPLAVSHLTLCRLVQKHPSHAMQVPGSPINRFFSGVFLLESKVIPELSFPFGLSILICASIGKRDIPH